MNEFFQKITSFFMAILMSILGLFGVKPEEPRPEDPTPPSIEEVEEQGDWLLENVPSFDAGYYSSALFNTGTGLWDDTATAEETDFEDDDLSRSLPSDASYMQLVRKTTLADVALYQTKLTEAGYAEVFENQIDNNFYYAYAKDDSQVYFYYNGYSGETRIIDDCCNTSPLQTFSYSSSETTYVSGEEIQPTVYQFSYPYRDAEHTGKDHYGSNGMLYAIVLSDGKLIVIDGGTKQQSSEQNIGEFWKFLHTITGQAEDAPITIALWYGTHAHGDHNGFFYKLLRRHSDLISLERAMFNFQADEVLYKNSYATRIRSIISTRYPDAQYIKVRCGYEFQLQDAFCEVLYSHEDFVNAKDATWTADNMNDGCCVLKMTIGGKTFLFPGDSNLIVEDVLLKKYTAATLKADVLQASHHLLNDLNRLYPVVAPTYVMCPASKLRATSTPYAAYLTLLQFVPEEHIFFANQNIVYGFTPQADGSITVSQTQVNCGSYDGTTLH